MYTHIQISMYRYIYIYTHTHIHHVVAKLRSHTRRWPACEGIASRRIRLLSVQSPRRKESKDNR